MLTPFFIAVFAFLIYRLTPILKSYDFIFSLSANTLIDLITLSILICLSSFLFISFACLSQELKLTLPIALLAGLIPMFFQNSLSLILAVAIFVSFLLTSLNLNSILKSYLTWEPEALLGPSIRHLSGLLILSFCLVYFLQISQVINQHGFQIPDNLIETAIKFSGLNPKVLDNLNPSSNDLIKQGVKDQIQTIIKPYQNIIPAILAMLLFLTLQSLTSILNLLIYPLLWLTFYSLEKIGFVKYELEQRPVKKLIV